MATRDELIAQRAEWVTALATAKATYQTLIAKTNKSYKFGGMGGESQEASKFTPKELREEISEIQAMIDAIDAALDYRTGVTRLGWTP